MRTIQPENNVVKYKYDNLGSSVVLCRYGFTGNNMFVNVLYKYPREYSIQNMVYVWI